jgi:hypothetical protein
MNKQPLVVEPLHRLVCGDLPVAQADADCVQRIYDKPRARNRRPNAIS